MLVAVTDHAVERFRQRVGSRAGLLDPRPEIAGRVRRAWEAGRWSEEPPPGATAARGSVYVRDLVDRDLLFVCRPGPGGAASDELVVISLWEEGRVGVAARGEALHRRPAIMGRMPQLGTILTAMVTPFDAQLRVDEEAAVRLMEHCVAHGSDGLVICGTTGEAATLTDEEHLRMIELAVQQMGGRATIVAGVGSNDTRHAVELTERATELGADGMLHVTPYYNRPNARGIKAHFAACARATHKPIMLYNIPLRTGRDMSNELLAELAQELDNVVAVKQANPDNLALIDGLDALCGRQ